MEQIEEISPTNLNLQGSKIGDYICSKKLGEGSYACVYSGFHIQDRTKIVALKVTDKRKYKGKNSEKFLKLIDAESKAMTVCNSDYIVKCYKRYNTKFYTIFVLEYCNNNSLFEEIQERKRIPEPQAKRILKQLVSAFAELHKNKIIHRDLKPENVFKHNGIYKIGDFGFCKVFQRLQDMTSTPLGSLISMAPEVIDGSPYGIKADLWSLGTVYYQMLFGKPPYISTSYQGMKRVINKNQIFLDGISKESVEFFQRVFVVDPKQRLSWSELYQLAIFRTPSMIFFENHQDDPDIDEAMQIHMTLQKFPNPEYSYYDKPQQNSKALILPFNSKISQVDIQDQNVRQSEKLMIQNIQNQINVKNNEMLSYKNHLNFQMQKSIFIYNEMYKAMDKIEIASNRQLLEFQLLIIARCFYIMSPLNDALNKQKNIFQWNFYKHFLNSPNHNSFLRDFKIHYQDIKKAKQDIQDKLVEQQAKISSQVKDFFRKSIFDRSSFKKQKIMLDGIQTKDYTRQQHTQFIITTYLIKIKEQISKQNIKDKKKSQRLQKAFDEFKKVALLDYDGGKGMGQLKKVYENLNSKSKSYF